MTRSKSSNSGSSSTSSRSDSSLSSNESARSVLPNRPHVETRPPQAFRSQDDPQTALHQAMMIDTPQLTAFLRLLDPLFRPKRLVLITLV